ncbi:hypothetical protein HanXRQr2_Chr11g0516481 [Helianthus annuus]|uniref:Uncharacterized protein n=1 Tax=Helianthus annuus TaxID=4232 RepID=A0A9K3N216_HELAN|nr:hypothetical protein HanXRQr2_Chr11g0516481 [Helianthus annuus]KAJ0877238.1 hypothetical protein HanPSC8_Chr11g0497801 [Helianthus annuus]
MNMYLKTTRLLGTTMDGSCNRLECMWFLSFMLRIYNELGVLRYNGFTLYFRC